MFCSNCGKQFEGNFCPFCGAQVHDLQKEKGTAHQSGNKVDSGVNNQKKADPVGSNNGGYMQDFVPGSYNTSGNASIKQGSGSNVSRKAQHTSKMAWMKWLFIGIFIAAVVAFPLGYIVSGVVFVIAGILVMPWLIEKAGKKKIWLIIGSVILILFGIASWYYDATWRERGTIEYIQTYPTAMDGYTIEEFFEVAFSEDELEWSYKEKSGKEYITVSFTEPDGVDESVVFSIDNDGYPILYDVIYDGKSNEDLFEGYNSRIFDRSGEKPRSTSASDDKQTKQKSAGTTEAAKDKGKDADAYYLMETIDEDPYWSVQVKNARVRAMDDGQGIEIHCTVCVQNKGETTAAFVSSNMFSDVDNDGIACQSIWSDWEIGNIPGETGGNIEVVFDFPAGANEDTSRISMMVCGKYKLYLTNRPGSDIKTDPSISYNENDFYWYMNSSTMYVQAPGGTNLQVVEMYGQYLQLVYGGNNMLYIFGLIPDYINEDGEFLYYSDGAMLKYDPTYDSLYLAISNQDSFDKFGGVYEKSEYEYTP